MHRLTHHDHDHSSSSSSSPFVRLYCPVSTSIYFISMAKLASQSLRERPFIADHKPQERHQTGRQ